MEQIVTENLQGAVDVKRVHYFRQRSSKEFRRHSCRGRMEELMVEDSYGAEAVVGVDGEVGGR